MHKINRCFCALINIPLLISSRLWQLLTVSTLWLYQGISYLMTAASQGHLEIVKELLAMSKGAKVDAKNIMVSGPHIRGVILRIS